MKVWLTDLPYVSRKSWPHGGFDFWPAGKMTVDPRVIVNHTTETLGLPGYNGGAAAPHFTGSLETGQVWQHVPLNYGSRCLAVSTKEDYRDVWHTDRTLNVTGTIQIEWIGAVTPGYPKKYGHYDIPNRFGEDEDAIEFVARLWRDIHEATDGMIPLSFSNYCTWVEYPGSYGLLAPQRLSSAEFRDARGIVAHQHAPANNHGDGLLGQAVSGKPVDMQKALDLARGKRPSPIVKPAPDPRKGFPQSTLDRVDHMLTELGYTGNVWVKTLAFQTEMDMEEKDGLPGPKTEKLLEAEMTKMDQVLAELRSVRTELAAVRAEQNKNNRVEIAKQVWGFMNEGTGPFNAFWWLRRGAVLNPEHRAFPADPGSPADLERRAQEKILGEVVPPYLGTKS